MARRHTVLGALVMASVLASPAAAVAVTTPFHRISGGRCAHAYLHPRVGPCPRAVPVLFGRLERGTCPDAGYVVPAGQHHVLAGPCGWLAFDVFEREHDLRVEALAPVLPSESYLALPLATCLPRTLRALCETRSWLAPLSFSATTLA